MGQQHSNSKLNRTTRKQSLVYCAFCLEENKDVIQFCKVCKLSLCDAHVTKHKEMKKTRSHFLVPIEQISNQIRLISWIPNDVTEHVLVPLLDARVLHYLKCTNYEWKRRIEEYIEESAPAFKFKAKIGSCGFEDGEFHDPYFVTTDKQGNIYVSDYSNSRIQIFGRDGQWKQSIKPQGVDNGQLHLPMGIAFNSNNHLIVANSNNHRVQIFNQDMQFINSFALKDENNRLFNTIGIAIDADDNIVVTDYSNHAIHVFEKDGKWKQRIGKKGSKAGEFNAPWDVAVSKLDSRIFVSDACNNRIQAFSSDGKFLFKFGSKGLKDGQFQCSRGLTLSYCGKYLLVCDFGNHRIQVFNAMNGLFIKSYGSYGSADGQFQDLSGICSSPSSGQVIVSQYEHVYLAEQHCIQIFE